MQRAGCVVEGTIRGFIEKAFWCCVIGVGHLLHRLVEPYQRLPWALARLVDKRCRDADKAAIAAWFMGLHDCCLDEGFSAKVRRMATGGSVDLLPGGRLHLQLKSSFHSKNTNMTVENNFARARRVCSADIRCPASRHVSSAGPVPGRGTSPAKRTIRTGCPT